MTAPAKLLALGALAVAGVVNARRPARGPLVFASWPAAWATTEMAPQIVVGATVAGAALVRRGALREPAGRLGLAGLLAADAVAIPLIVRSRRTVVELDGDHSDLELDADSHEPAGGTPYPRIHLLAPFLAWRRRDVKRITGVPYAPGGRRAHRLDVFMPAAPAAAARPAIIHVHGGAWTIGSRREQGIPLLGHLAANGWIGFNVDYRLSPRATWPDHIVDVKRAIAWVREHADELGVDPSFIAITGGSAGGHLSALAALTAGDASLQPGFEEADTSVAACVPFYGVYDFLDEERIHLTTLAHVVERIVFKARRRDDPERFRAASPIHRLRRDAPPFLVVHGESDSLVPVEEARRFVRALREASDAPVLYAEMQGAQHAFAVVPSWRTIPVIEAIERFLAAVRSPGEAELEEVAG